MTFTSNELNLKIKIYSCTALARCGILKNLKWDWLDHIENFRGFLILPKNYRGIFNNGIYYDVIEDFLFRDRQGDQYTCLGDHIYQNQCIFWSWRPHIRLPSAGISAQTCSNLRSFLLSLARPVKLHFELFFLLILEILVNEAGRVAYNFISSAREPRPGQPVCPARGFLVIAAKLHTGDQILVSSSASLSKFAPKFWR